MALTRWGFESGTNGDVLNGTNANADFAVVTGGTATISTAQKFEGTRAALMTATTTSGSVYFQKTVTTTSQLGVDAFIYLTALPTTESGIIWVGNGATRQCHLAIATDGKIRIRDGGGSGGASLWTSTASMALSTWYRVSFFATQDATAGTIRAAFYAGSSASPIDDSTLLTGRNTGASQYTLFRIGPKVSTGTGEETLYVDYYGYDSAATSLLPIASAPVAVASASGLVSYVNASTSTGTGLTYGISQTSGPTKTATNIGTGQWIIPVDASSNTTWLITITQSDSQTDTESVTVFSQAGELAPVELLYATGPGTFV